MARARNIKPGFYKNEDLAECSIWARFIFPGLWMLADREGRLEDRPKRIKGELLPFDSQEVEPLLRELQEFGFIERYEIDGLKVIQILKFTAHQSPHFSEKPSELPERFQESPTLEENKFPESPTLEVVCKRKNSESTPALKGGSQPPDSLNPYSLNPDSSKPPANGGVSHFEKFWSAYPKKVGKGAAEKAWQKAKINGHAADVIAAVEQQKHSEQWQKDGGQFIPNPATWLNQRRWEDELHVGGSAGASSPLFSGML